MDYYDYYRAYEKTNDTETANDSAEPKPNEYSLIAVVGRYFVTLPVDIDRDYVENSTTCYYLIDGTEIIGSIENGFFVIKIFDRNSEIMQNIIKSITLERCYDNDHCNIPDEAVDRNMEIARILKDYGYCRGKK